MSATWLQFRRPAPSDTMALVLLVIFVLTLCYLYRFSKQRPTNFPPGPPRLPLWGSYWFVLLQNYKFLHFGFHKLAQKYRTSILGLYLGSFATVVVHDYESVRQVLTRPEFQGRIKVPIFDMRTYNKNLGIIFTDDQFWTEQRRFALRHLREFGFGRRFPHLEHVVKEEIQDVLDLLHGRREDKEIFSDGLTLVPNLFYTVVFNALWLMITGERYSTKEHGKLRYFTQQALRFQKSIDVTGNALVQTPWIRHFAPYYVGFTDLMEATQNMLKYMEDGHSIIRNLEPYSSAILCSVTGCSLPGVCTIDHIKKGPQHGLETLRNIHPMREHNIQEERSSQLHHFGNLKTHTEAVTQHKATYSNDHMRDFIDIYLKEMKKQGMNGEISSFSDEQLKVVGIEFLFPASTTVTSTLNFAMLFLLHYPEVQTKMQQELDAVVGRDRLPTLDDRAGLPYNEAFLREVMRKEAVAPLAVLHRSTEDTELGGYNIPKDTVMILNLWSFHNDPKFWGDPEAFRPERFLDEKGHLLKKDYSLPFGAGKRLCAGETFARHTMFLIVSALLQNFTVKRAPGKPLPSMEPDLPGVIITKKDMWMKFEPRA